MIIPFLIVIIGIGYILLNPDNKQNSAHPILFPMGLSVLMFVNIFGLICKIRTINYFLIILVLFFILWKIYKKTVSCKNDLFLPMIITGLISMTLYFFNNVLMTYDSFKLFEFGLTLANKFKLGTIAENLSTWGFGGIFPSYIYEMFSETQHLNKFFHFVFFATAYLMYAIMLHLHPQKNKRDIMFILGCVVLYFTMPMLIRSNGYIHNNGLAALFVLSAVYCYLLKLPWSFLISVITFSFIRVELPIIGLIMMFLFIDAFSKKDQKWILPIWLISILAWNVFILLHAPEDNSISSVKKQICMLLLICGGFIAVWLNTFSKRVTSYFDHETLELIVGFGFVIFLLVPFTRAQRHLQTSASNTMENILSFKNYGSSLFFIVFYFVTYFQNNVRKEIVRIRIFVLFYFATIIALSIFRKPYKLSWGDSANRMMLHLMPLILIIAVVSFFQFDYIENHSHKKNNLS